MIHLRASLRPSQAPQGQQTEPSAPVSTADVSSDDASATPQQIASLTRLAQHVGEDAYGEVQDLLEHPPRRLRPGRVCDRQTAAQSPQSRETGRHAGSSTRLSRDPYEALPETHVVVISQVYTGVIVDGTPSDVMEAIPRPSSGTAAAERGPLSWPFFAGFRCTSGAPTG
jgi:hypothetical protein